MYLWPEKSNREERVVDSVEREKIKTELEAGDTVTTEDVVEDVKPNLA